MKLFYVAALTGRSGSGKSYASHLLADMGVAVIDGDAVAREIVEPGSAALGRLVRTFGRDILFEDGTLNHRRLGDICFADPDKKSKLDGITHPAIIERITQRFDELKAAGKPYCVVEAPALIESGLYSICDRCVMIEADEEREIERLIERDSLTHEQARRRLSAQTSPDDVRPLCDLVIQNNGTVEEFEQAVLSLKLQLDMWFNVN